MPCFNPMQAVRDLQSFTKNGKNHVSFVSRTVTRVRNGFDSDRYQLLDGLPCGQCVGCRLERSRQWAIRMMNEAQLHTDTCFITLTFNEESLHMRENPLSLDKKEFPDFMKRFRFHVSEPRGQFYNPDYSVLLSRDERKVIRYYMCGEYGDLYKRPHYHAIIFGFDFPDKKLEKVENGFRYYSSDMLRSLWPFGNNIITDVSFDTCAYVARYIMKKHLGKDAWMQYFEYFDEISGELVGHRLPEYTTMSRRSGIGKEWFDKYLADVYPRDEIFMKGRGFSKPPKAYDRYFELINPDGFASIKEKRQAQSLLQSHDNTLERLDVKRTVKLAQIRSLKRDLEF